MLGDAIEMADQALSQDNNRAKVVVLLSDGEDHDEKAAEMAKEAVKRGIIIHTIGIGSATGAPIFDPATGRNKIDQQGNEVISKLNEPELKSIASAGKGTYQLLNNNNRTADALLETINKMEAKQSDMVIFVQYKSYFQYFMLITVVLLLVDGLIPAAGKSVKTQKITTDTLKEA
ncbi:von Willebrand factor type A domain protein [compost metagenome]